MLELTDKNFDNEIQKARKLVLVDFFAEWCSPCQILSPILEKLEKEFEGKVIFTKANVDLTPIACQKLGINPIPTMILFQNGKPISQFIGLQPDSAIREWLVENLKNNEEKIKETIKEYEKYAQDNDLKLNPDRGVVERIIKGLLNNEKKYGLRYCPCRRVSGNPEDDKSKICPCQWHLQEIEEQGHCFCGLFVK